MTVDLVEASVTTDLRRAVLRPAWPVGTPMHGDEDPSALHLAGRTDGGTVVGAVVLLPAPYPLRPDEPNAWQLRGMATAEEHRRRGIGAELLAAAVHLLRARGARLLWCQARQSAIAFYARHGFTAAGELFEHAETGITHQYMYRELSDGSGASST